MFPWQHGCKLGFSTLHHISDFLPVKQIRLHFCTFVIEDAFHLHGGPGMGDAEHRAGHQALLGRRAVCGPDQAPVWFVVTALQDLHSLTPPHCQLVAVAGHKVVYDHSQLTAAGELWKTRPSLRPLLQMTFGFKAHNCRRSGHHF